jgi:phage-related protein
MDDKVVVLLHGDLKTPPMSKEAREEAGKLLRQLQWGFTLSMPQSRPMSVIGPRCHELRVQDTDKTWRIMYRVSETEIVVMEVFAKKTTTTPQSVIENCKKRLALYDATEG